MEWLESFLSQDLVTLLIAITMIVACFIFIAYRTHVKHLKRMKKINQTFRLDDDS